MTGGVLRRLRGLVGAVSEVSSSALDSVGVRGLFEKRFFLFPSKELLSGYLAFCRRFEC